MNRADRRPVRACRARLRPSWRSHLAWRFLRSRPAQACRVSHRSANHRMGKHRSIRLRKECPARHLPARIHSSRVSRIRLRSIPARSFPEATRNSLSLPATRSSILSSRDIPRSSPATRSSPTARRNNRHRPASIPAQRIRPVRSSRRPRATKVATVRRPHRFQVSPTRRSNTPSSTIRSRARRNTLSRRFLRSSAKHHRCEARRNRCPASIPPRRSIPERPNIRVHRSIPALRPARCLRLRVRRKRNRRSRRHRGPVARSPRRAYRRPPHRPTEPLRRLERLWPHRRRHRRNRLLDNSHRPHRRSLAHPNRQKLLQLRPRPPGKRLPSRKPLRLVEPMLRRPDSSPLRRRIVPRRLRDPRPCRRVRVVRNPRPIARPESLPPRVPPR